MASIVEMSSGDTSWAFMNVLHRLTGGFPAVHRGRSTRQATMITATPIPRAGITIILKGVMQKKRRKKIGQ